MASTHAMIDEANLRYRIIERRFNYTTPKSFLELIEFYKQLLKEKRGDITTEVEKIRNGLTTLAAI